MLIGSRIGDLETDDDGFVEMMVLEYSRKGAIWWSWWGKRQDGGPVWATSAEDGDVGAWWIISISGLLPGLQQNSQL
jgi:hypothetical protein